MGELSVSDVVVVPEISGIWTLSQECHLKCLKYQLHWPDNRILGV